MVDEGPEWGTGEWSVVLYCDGNPVIEEDNLNLAHPRDGGIAGVIAERMAALEGKPTADPRGRLRRKYLRGRTADHQSPILSLYNHIHFYLNLSLCLPVPHGVPDANHIIILGRVTIQFHLHIFTVFTKPKSKKTRKPKKPQNSEDAMSIGGSSQD